MCYVVPPTVFLPPLKLLKACSDKELSNAIASLRYIYLPEVRGSSRRRANLADTTQDLPLHLTIDSHMKKSSILSEIRADPFERKFAIQWLTRFVSLFSEAMGESPVSSQALEEAASLLAVCAGSAASGSVTRTFTFSLSSGVSLGSSGLRSTGNEEISVILRDAPLDSSDFSSVGAQTWGGSCILAEMIAENPRNFSIFSKEGVEPNSLQPHVSASFRALELGAGTGLASLMLGKVIERIRSVHIPLQEGSLSGNPQRTLNVDTVVATDFHPSVLANLRLNFAVNFPHKFTAQICDDTILRTSQTDLVPNMVVLPLNWSVIHSLAPPISSPRMGSSFVSPETHTIQISMPTEDTPSVPHCHTLDADTSFQPQVQARTSNQTDIPYGRHKCSGDNAIVQTTAPPASLAPELDVPFDLIIGADIIYEQSHARWVRSCVERFLRKPIRHYDPFSLLMDQHPATALFHLVIPLRHTHPVECRSVEVVFPQAADVLSSRQLSQSYAIPSQSYYAFGATDHTGIPSHPDRRNVSFPNRNFSPVPLELAIIHQEDIWCDAYSDHDAEDVLYRYYQIGWV